MNEEMGLMVIQKHGCSYIQQDPYSGAWGEFHASNRHLIDNNAQRIYIRPDKEQK